MAVNFKSDDSFLRKLVVGAAGVNATMNTLKNLGFSPIELERGSTGFKIWKKIKIKRIRVPDILCLKTGLRFESRGKTKLEISMSHSLNDPKRAWDYGMRDDDFVSIVAFYQDEFVPIKIEQISPLHFITVKEMRHCFLNNQVTITKPKGFEEGSEIRVIWNSALSNYDSKVFEITPEKIIFTPTSNNGKKQTILLKRNKGKINLLPQISKGDCIKQNQIVASVVPINLSLSCPPVVNESYFLEKLQSVNLSERYAAAKALRYKGFSTKGKKVLIDRMLDSEEDIYVLLEVAAALATSDNQDAWKFIESKLYSPYLTVPLETQLETIIVISEIPSQNSEKILIDILKDNNRDTELRAGAAWALGQFPTKNTASALVNIFDLNNTDIKIESARALLRIGEEQKEHLVSLIKSIPPNKRDGISWVLARIGNFDINKLADTSDDNLRMWASYILGYGKDGFTENQIENICKSDPEIYFAASVLWQILNSWINGLLEY